MVERGDDALVCMLLFSDDTVLSVVIPYVRNANVSTKDERLNEVALRDEKDAAAPEWTGCTEADDIDEDTGADTESDGGVPVLLGINDDAVAVDAPDRALNAKADPAGVVT